MTPDEMLEEISHRWFLSEPAFYALYCTQQLTPNITMECGFRCGHRCIEYNPAFLRHKNYAEVEQLLRIEMIRLFLKHPYDRQPMGCGLTARTLGSDCTIADGYCFLSESLPLKGPADYSLPLGHHYEWYAKKIQEQLADNDDSQPTPQPQPQKQDSPSDSPSTPPSPQNEETGNREEEKGKQDKEQVSQLWEDDELMRARIDDVIGRTSDWGSIPADMVERIKASSQGRLNNHNVLQGFRSSILASHSRLTRWRPNRRTDFEQMGRTNEYRTRLLVAVDVSGSIDADTIARFYSAINRIFSYGIFAIDCLQFDATLHGIAPMRYATREITAEGRGGTSFQPLFDFLAECDHTPKAYDGAVILTDGEAPAPVVRRSLHTRILWACRDEHCYQNHHDWMSKSGRCCFVTL